MKKITFLLSFAFVSLNTFAAVNASSLKLKVYGVAVSLTADCANPIVLFDSTSPTEVDFVSAPSLGSGDIADGTYQCVMINVSDQIKHTPATTSGSCTAGTEYTGQICQPSESTELRSGTAFGSNTSCTAGEDRVTLYLQTGTTRTSGGNAFRKPTTTADTTFGFQLGSAFVVSGTSTGTFVVNTDGKVDGSSSECGMNAPIFSFR